MYLDDPFRTRYRYTDFLQLPLAYNPGLKNILFIGLGGGSAQKRIWRDFPQLDLQVVGARPGGARRGLSLLPSFRAARG